MTSARDIQASDASDLVESCRELIAGLGLEEIVVAGADTNGILRGKRIPAQRFAEDPTAGVAVSDLVFVLDAKGEIVPRPHDFEGWWPSPEVSGFADVVLVPDLATFRSLPWAEGTGIVLGDFREVDGGELAASPQAVLRRVVERATGLGLHPRMAAELEFFILDRPSAEGYLTMSPGDDDFLLRALTDHLAALGLEVIASNREGGPGQYEITIGHSGLPQAAVEASLLRYAVKDVARIHRARATFMSKPTDSIFGSGCHLHQSLLSEDGRNLFFDPDAAGGLSKVALSYIAGQLACLSDFTAVWSSTPNAYKRLEPYSGASVAWAFENRAAAVRVATPDAEKCRVELRAPGGETNVYLAMAAALAGGLHGIEKGLAPPEPSTGHFYEDAALQTVPRSLSAAIDRFEASEVAREYLGEEFVRFYAGTRRWEVEQERKHVTDWELDRYSEGF